MKPTILLQLDTDPQPSVFDRIVALDSGVGHVLSYGNVTPQSVTALVHGCIFTRGGAELARTAIFVGGSDADAAEALFRAARAAMLPGHGLSVSILLDPNGANTTAAAAVRAADRYIALNNSRALVLGGTGPVGRRVARLLARAGAWVRVGSRQKGRAQAVCDAIRAAVPAGKLEAVSVAASHDGPDALDGCDLVIAAGAPGALLLPKKLRDSCRTLKVAIDLNGVPPAGIEGVELRDNGVERDGVVTFGALGVGGAKMKLHKAALRELYTRNDLAMDVDEVMGLAGV